ncbi:MAG: LPS export ABC transporter periplasmic protein LptC [Bacteroidales bacterium]|nr:LPS export ABC transporter periplasmic protein LptC [Bacteroidales bacterium]
MLLSSCKEEVADDTLDTSVIPIQVVRDMAFVQSDKGFIQMRMTAPKMEHFQYAKEQEEVSYDLYSEGFHVDLYTPDGALETEVNSKQAKHETTSGKESWSAFGDVVIINHIKQEYVESDTIYWDRAHQKIHTDCYVKITSPQGVMQGYGMESDERASHAVILKPFDSYSVMQDSTHRIEIIDSLNFVGPPVQRFAQK